MWEVRRWHIIYVIMHFLHARISFSCPILWIRLYPLALILGLLVQDRPLFSYYICRFPFIPTPIICSPHSIVPILTSKLVTLYLAILPPVEERAQSHYLGGSHSLLSPYSWAGTSISSEEEGCFTRCTPTRFLSCRLPSSGCDSAREISISITEFNFQGLDLFSHLLKGT